MHRWLTTSLAGLRTNWRPARFHPINGGLSIRFDGPSICHSVYSGEWKTSGATVIYPSIYHAVLLIICLGIPTNAAAQIDTLLDRSFNDRYPVLEQWIYPGRTELDSADLHERFITLKNHAKQKNNIPVQLEVECILLKIKTGRKENKGGQLVAHYLSLIDRANLHNYPFAEAILNFDLAEYNWRSLEQYEIAMQYYIRAYDIVKQIPDHSFYLKQRVVYTLGERYYELSDYPTAVQYLIESDQVRHPIDTTYFKISIWNTLALAYLSMSEYNLADHYFQKALDQAILEKSNGWIGNLYGNLGHVKIMKGDYINGKRLLQMDKDLSLARGPRSSAAGAFLELAKISFFEGDMAAVISQVDSAQGLMGSRMPFERKKVLFPLLSKIHGYRGDWKLAALYMDSSFMVRDSILKKANALQQLRMQQRKELEDSKAEIIRAEERDNVRTRQIYAMILGLLLAFTAVIIILRQKKKVSQARKRSDELLLNILPVDVANELKATGSSQAKRYPNVTVLFSDFKNFTHHAQNMRAVELVGILDHYFKAFDRITSEFGLEKIKTVGDAYICVSGLPVEDDQHAEKVVRAAIAMQQEMNLTVAGWELRIGIHTGPVVAGIVGTKKFAYDIWGDTVNTAARMEQGAEAGMINISQTTYDLVHKSFHCIHRGKLAAKNKGELDMYAVEQG